MSRYGFSYVHAAGFTGFRPRLQEGEWGSIDLTGLTLTPGTPIPEALLTAPRRIAWKALLTWSVSLVEAALSHTDAPAPSTLDPRWDAAQRQLRNAIVSFLDDESPELRTAAERLQRALLQGEGGLGQTKLSFRQEADFGETQVRLSRQEPLAGDIARLGLGRFLDRIERETQALRAAVGTTVQAAGLQTERQEKLRQALRDASGGFTRVLGDIDWFLENLSPSASHEMLGRLREPLQELLLRYPGPSPIPTTLASEPASESSKG